jgi:hypothetical protein
MKKLLSVLLIFVLIISLTACGNGIGAVTPKYSSDVHSKEDIETAIRVATYYFIKEFDGCQLLTITYGGDDMLENHKEFVPSGKIEDVIVLVSSFYVSPNGGDGSLNQNDIYTGWKWIIVKDSDGNWVHKDHGYA